MVSGARKGPHLPALEGLEPSGSAGSSLSKATLPRLPETVNKQTNKQITTHPGQAFLLLKMQACLVRDSSLARPACLLRGHIAELFRSCQGRPQGRAWLFFFSSHGNPDPLRSLPPNRWALLVTKLSQQMNAVNAPPWDEDAWSIASCQGSSPKKMLPGTLAGDNKATLLGRQV